MDGRIVKMTVLVVCGVDEQRQRGYSGGRTYAEGVLDTYLLLFRDLQEHGLRTPRLVISDAHSGLVEAIRKGFPGAS